VDEIRALVLFGDVIGSGKDRVAATTWLRDVVAELDEAYGAQRLAPFGFTQGDELQGLLVADADPLVAVLHAALGSGEHGIRWVCVLGGVDPGDGPATQRTGQAFLAARKTMEEARSNHDRLVIKTGRQETDALLADMTPALVDLLDDLTARQRDVTRLAVLEGLRQSEVADRLKVRRATTTVAFKRAKVHSIQRLATAIRQVHAAAAADLTAAAAVPVLAAPAADPARSSQRVP
jgi:DNA-binding CsgD family transcriptional regulator